MSLFLSRSALLRPYVPPVPPVGISFIDSATSATSSVTAPAGIIAGDLLLFAQVVSAGSTPADTYPSGFTPATTLVSAVPTNIRQSCSYKLATGSEASTSISGLTGTTYRNALAVFRRDITATSLTLSSISQVESNSNPDAQVIPSAGATPPVVCFGVFSSNDPIPSANLSPAADGTVIEEDATRGIRVLYRIITASPANVSADMDDEGSNNMIQAFYIEMA